jgi:serine/threonine-protein kinase
MVRDSSSDDPASAQTQEAGVSSAEQESVEQADTLAEPASGSWPLSPEPGGRLERITHFEILGEIGSGGMGVVLEARDLEIDRKVAIKLLRPDVWQGRSAEIGRARLLREAQAMGKLSHPNVVTVYEAGTVDDSVFLAMEYVKGQTLRLWMKKAGRSRQEIIELFCAAGSGLAAAHHAGLVHRDFKPDNVLIGADGRPRVTDFGIVGIAGGQEDDDAGASRGDGPLSSRDPLRTPASTSLTRDGAVLGTPAYMAPEQHRGLAVDARADQFSFCVCLYEALYGRRPFGGKTYAELANNILEGRIREGLRDPDVPPQLRAVLLRGLSVEPDDRFASMDELLDQLQADPFKTRKGLAVAAAFVALAGLAVFGFLRGTSSEACTGAADKMAGVWDAKTRARLQQAFAATKLPEHQRLFERVVAGLDQYRDRWVAMRTDACKATQRKEQSTRILDLRMACLDRRLERMGALTALLSGSINSGVAVRATAAVLELPPLEGCADFAALDASFPPPDDEATQRKVTELRTELGEVQVRHAAGRFKEALSLARPLAERALRVEYLPLQAEALALLGELQSGAGKGKQASETLRKAIRLAARVRDLRLEASAWVHMIFAVGVLEARYAEALALTTAAEAAVARSEKLRDVQIVLHVRIGNVLEAQGKFDLARMRYERAIELGGRVYPPDDVRRTLAMFSLGYLLRRRGKTKRARALFDQVLAIREKVLGGSHPGVADVLNHLALLDQREGDVKTANRRFLRALQIRQNAFGPEHPRVASTLNGLGLIAKRANDLPAAQRYFERSFEVWSKALGPDHPNVATPLNNLGTILRRRGKLDRAQKVLERALEIRRAAHGPRHHRVAISLNMLGDLALAQGNPKKALERCAEALQIDEKFGGPTHSDLVYDLNCRGEALRRLGRTGDAVVDLERSLSIQAKRKGINHEDRGITRFALARALWTRRGQRKRALTMAREAESEFVAGSRTRQAAEVKRWLSTHRN